MARSLPAVLAPRIGFLLAVASQHVTDKVEAELAPLGINSRQFGLLLLLDSGGPQTQAALGTTAHIDRTSMVGFVDGLEQLGLVARRRHPTDRRAHQVALTDAGQALLGRASAVVDAAEAAATHALTPAQARSLAALLRQMMTGGTA